MKNSVKFIALILAAVLLISTCPVFAASLYKDVPDSYWSLPDIVLCKDCKVFEGYADGTFRPANSITQQQLLVVLYRILKYGDPDFDETDYTEVCMDSLTKMNVGDWAKPQLAYGLVNGYIKESEFEKYKAGENAYRINIGVWSAKAVGYEISPMAVLPYSDTASIDAGDMAYIDALYRHGIMKGKSDGSFGGKDFVTRGQMAAVCARILREKEAAKELTMAQSLVLKSGVLNIVNKDRRTLLLISGGKYYTLRIAEDAEILLDGESISFAKLAEHSGETLTFSAVAGGANTVLVQSQPMLKTATVDSLKTLDDFVMVNVTDDQDNMISLAASPDLAKGLSEDITIRYIADGAQLLSWK